jgi:hypothetical protein
MEIMQIREAFVPTPFGVWLQAHHKELFLPSIAIAEMAQNSGPLLLTCKLKHFQSLGVACADPLIALPV